MGIQSFLSETYSAISSKRQFSIVHSLSSVCVDTGILAWKEELNECVESNMEELKKVLNKTIASIKSSDSDTRESWISELEDLCRKNLDQLKL